MKKLIQIVSWAAAIMLFAVATLPCRAADSAVLRNGFSIRHSRRQVIGAVTRLFVGGDDSSFVDVPTAEIDHFEFVPDEPASALNVQASAGKMGQRKSAPIDLNEVVRSASGAYSLDPDLVNSVIRAESGFNVRAVSPKGAQGLMQLMPQTASQLGVQNVFDPRANVEGGTRYLRELLERYDFDLIKALAAYNAGTQRVEQYGGVPPYYETKAYVARIVRDFNRKKIEAKKVEAKKIAAKNAAPPRAQKNTARTATHSPATRVSTGSTPAKTSSTPAGESN